MPEDHGLRPIDPPIVIGFSSIDELIEALPEDMPVEDDYGHNDEPEDWTPDAKPTS